MKVLVSDPHSKEIEPHFLVDWAPPSRGRSWVVSLVLHVLGIGLLLLIPQALLAPHGFTESHAFTQLTAPPRELTQIAPNRSRIAHEFSLQNLQSRRVQPVPVPAPRLAPLPAPPKTTLKAPVLSKPPEITESKPLLAQTAPKSVPNIPPAPPPQIQTQEKPKLAFESPGANNDGAPQQRRGLAPPRLTASENPIAEAVHAAAERGPHGLSVGDLEPGSAPDVERGWSFPQKPGKPGAALEMMSDPQGVDFRPYLIQILATVKRNWLAVYPESARLGRRGKVQLQFIVAHDGQVPKLVIALPSGTDAFDRAAVAGISASVPFPPLPTEYRGSEVRLQFTFVYNMK